jgi:phosphoribosylglycinamide formyltransferase-1
MRRRAQTLLTMAWMGNALAYVAANVLLPVKMRLAGEAGIVDLATAAAITSVWGFLRVFGFIALWKWSGWHYRVRWLLGAQITLWLSFVLMMVINTQPMLVAMQVVFGLATAMLYASSLYYAMHVSDGHGGHAGIHEALIGLGICIGPAVGAIAGAGLGGHEALVHIAECRLNLYNMTKPLTHLPPLRLGILLSGGGTTLQNLAEVIARGEIHAKIACVIASNTTCYGIERATNLQLPLYVITRKDCGTLEAFSERVAHILRHHSINLALMAGFLSLWQIPDDFAGRVLNIHPALLPKFGGKGMHGEHVHAAVINAREVESGCTVHFADNTYDTGPTIIQKKVPVLPSDTPDTLAARVFEQECLAYPEAIRMYIEGKLKAAR